MDNESAEAKHLLAFIERIERLEEDKKQVRMMVRASLLRSSCRTGALHGKAA